MSTVLRWVVAAVLLIHGLVHLMGVAKGLDWAQVAALTEPIGARGAVAWLLAAVLVVTAAVSIAAGTPTWWIVALAAAVVSEAVILTAWADAKAGTAGNVILLLAAGYGFASLGPSSFSAEWDQRASAVLEGAPLSGEVLTEADLGHLPDPVAAYVRRSTAVGKPKVSNFYATVHGRIRSGPDKPWMSFTGRQLNTYGEDAQRLCYLDAAMFGLPVTVFHVFDEDAATMRGKVLSLVSILDAEGPEMNRAETVTLLNDMVVLAPAALVDAPVQWTTLSEHRVRAAYTRGAQTVTAELVFDRNGDLVDFVSDDRSRASADGKSFTRLRWNTPLRKYRDLDGRRVAVQGQGMWEAPEPEGLFAYIDFLVDDLAYNVTSAAIPSRRPTQAAAVAVTASSAR